MVDQGRRKIALAFDTANEVIAIGVGALDSARRAVEPVASVAVEARRASNTQLLTRIDAVLAGVGAGRGEIACVACGRGPGSFTGVRIAMATAKGVASALGVPLVGVSTADAVAWGAQAAGVRGRLAVVADAMRKEVYPVRFDVCGAGVERLDPDTVAKADAAAEALASAARELASAAGEAAGKARFVTGDALRKYRGLFEACGEVLPEPLWTPTGAGLLAALQAAWRAGEADPLDARRHDPAFALPVYTRLSDAEEGERARLARPGARDLVTGVQGAGAAAAGGIPAAGDGAPAAGDGAPAAGDGGAPAVISGGAAASPAVAFRPLDAAHAADVAALEARIMGSDAWSEALVADELPRADRTWWAAYAVDAGEQREAGVAIERGDARLVGYAGGWVVDGGVQVLKVGVDPAWRRRGVARALLSRVAADARDLGAQGCSLEVRAGNAEAQAFYRALGFSPVGTRPRYYSDREDALLMQGPLPLERHDVAGMRLEAHDDAVRATHAARPAPAASADSAPAEAARPAPAASARSGPGEPPTASVPAASSHPAPVRPLILAIESSCDETAAAIIDGAGALHADVLASQIDFHARFGGVVPEIASRKHIEAICGVCEECFDVAALSLGMPSLSWGDLDAVSATYAPGLVGALVVGVAFAKGAAWALDVPFIGVNHLEGHLYANKVGAPDFAPPAVVSLVSGGNTMLVHMRGWGDYATLGATIDDAVGEAFDKVAKALGLGYPGGPVISKLAAEGDPRAIPFPRAMLHSGDLRFSLSGLKTAVTSYIAGEQEAGRELNLPDIAASFQQAVIDVQIAKAKTALRDTGAPTFCLGGGVAANPALRAAYERLCAEEGVRLVMPPLSACGDNAGMIALVALDRYRAGRFFGLDADALAHASLDEPY